MREFLIALVITIIFSFCIGYGVIKLDEHSCNDYSTVTGKDTLYQAGVCYVKVNGAWHSRIELRVDND